MRERDRRLERIADHVVEEAVALEASGDLGGHARALRMNEHEHAERLGLRPEWVELRVADLLAVDAAADGRAAEPVLLHALFEQLGGKLGMLQRHRRVGDEPVGIGRARRRELLVLDLADLLREVALGLVPIGIDAQRFHVDALLVHGAQPARHAGDHVELRPRGRCRVA